MLSNTVLYFLYNQIIWCTILCYFSFYNCLDISYWKSSTYMNLMLISNWYLWFLTNSETIISVCEIITHVCLLCLGCNHCQQILQSMIEIINRLTPWNYFSLLACELETSYPKGWKSNITLHGDIVVFLMIFNQLLCSTARK